MPELKTSKSGKQINVKLTFDNKVYLKFNNSDINIKYCTDCYTANTLCFKIEDLRKVVNLFN